MELIGACVVVVLVIFLSCRKIDYTSKEETMKPGLRFFDTHQSTDPGLNAIAALLKKENEKYNFIGSITSTVGYPYWEKTISIKRRNGSARGATDDSAEYYYIPFVRDSQNYVNSSLVVKVGAADTSVRWLSDWQYADYGFDTTNANEPNAKKAFMTLANLERSAFGHNKFLVKDGRIFGYPDTQRLKVTVDLPESQNRETNARNTEEVIVICQRVSVCVTAGPSQSTRGLNDPVSSGCGALYSALYCNVYMFYGGGGSNGSGWTTIGSGYVPDTGGSGGTGLPLGYIEGWSPPPNPCGSNTQRGGSVQVCESSWVVIDNVPPSQSEPIDTLLKRYATFANRYRDSLSNLCETDSTERFYNIVELNSQLDTFRVLKSTSGEEINPNYNMTGGRILKGEWHYHSKYADGTSGSWPSGGDVAKLFDKHTGHVMIVDTYDARYALVVENDSLMNVWKAIPGNGPAVLPGKVRNAVLADPRSYSTGSVYVEMTKEKISEALGNFSSCGIGLYKASAANATTFIKQN